MTLPTAHQPAGDTGQPENPFPPGPVEELLRQFVKAARAHQLYLPNNPVYRGAIDGVRGAFSVIWRQTTSLPLKFTDTEIRWYGCPVLVEATKSSDSLPWTFFKDGIREIELSPGFEEHELVKLLDILQRVRKTSPEEDDLLTMLWEADFADLRYRYVDVGSDPVAPLVDGSEPAAPASGEPVDHAGAAEAGGEGADASAQSAVVNMQDFDATLYFLDDHELDYLRLEIEREYNADLRQNVVATLLDIYEAQAAPAIREEVSDLLENLLVLLLAAGQLRTVAFLLSEAQVTIARAPDVTDEQRRRLGDLPGRLSAPEPLGQLLQALDESPEAPSADSLASLFEQLRPLALGTVFAWLPRMRNDSVRGHIERAADRLASTNTAELVALINASERVVATEAVRRAGAMKTPAAVAPLARVLANSADVELRQLAVQALTDIGSAGAMQALERSIADADRDVRVAAVRTLGAKAFRGVFGRLEAVVKGKAIRQADLTEKMAFFEAFGAMCGDGGVAFLDGILNGKSMFGKRDDPEFRACAAMALGRIGSRKATDALQRASGEKDVIVRNAVGRAMRSGST